MVPKSSIRNLLLTLGAAALAVLVACAAGNTAANDAVGDATQSDSATAAAQPAAAPSAAAPSAAAQPAAAQPAAAQPAAAQSATEQPATVQPATAPSAAAQSGAAPPATAESAAVQSEPAAVGDASENTKLEALARARRADQSEDDFTLGPGDVLQCSVPAIEDLKDRSVRVSGDDTIALPLIGVVDVKGMTEQDVRNALKKRLEKYMYDPQVEVFAKEYQSRQVAVVGMVQKPGLYPLTSPSDTVLSTISRAGGMTEAAAPRLLLIPAPPHQGARTSALLAAAAGIGETGSTDHAAHDVPPALAHTDPILIDLSNTGGESQLDLPARPGDVIIVPAAGEVMVKGWVKNEGAFKITPGLTVLGAVTAAGGQMFSSSAEILRTDPNGGKVEIQVDLAAIEKMSAPDVPVQAGDIVIVNRSATGAVPYALYSLFEKFGTGFSMMAY